MTGRRHLSRPTEIEVLRAQVDLLKEAHTVANGALRSAWQIAERDGRKTNWSGFRETLRYSLDVSHAAINALISNQTDPGKEGGG